MRIRKEDSVTNVTMRKRGVVTNVRKPVNGAVKNGKPIRAEDVGANGNAAR